MKALINTEINVTKLIIIFLVILMPIIQSSCKKSDDGQKDNDDQSDGLSYAGISKLYLSSTRGNTSRPLMICLPSNYETLTTALPVLYLFHGWGQNELSWITEGGIIDKLSAAYNAGTITPMIVVMPLCTFCDPLEEFCFRVGPEEDDFVKEMVTDIIPWVESNYNVATDRKHRAIGGLSAGGHQTLNIAIFYPEKFDYVYPMSAGFFEGAIQEIETGVFDDVFKNPEINNIKKFTFFTGKQDNGVMPVCQATMALLDDYGIQYDYWEADGKHDWTFWKLCLDIILPELFQEESK